MQFRVTNKLPQMPFTEMNAMQKVNVMDRFSVCVFNNVYSIVLIPEAIVC